MAKQNRSPKQLSATQLAELGRLTTPTVFNGWELITLRDATCECFNRERLIDFAPRLGPMVGRAVTAVIQPGARPRADNGKRWAKFRAHVASIPGPKILVVQDLDRPMVYGAVWGEIGANTFRTLGCVGTITDGGVRDVDEMAAAGFKAMARSACVGHGSGVLVEFGDAVEVFGVDIKPGQLIHADQHGFLAIPPEDESRVLDASLIAHAAEAELLRAARASGLPHIAFLKQFDGAIQSYLKRIRECKLKRGEW